MAAISRVSWKAGGKVKTAWRLRYVDAGGARHSRTFPTRREAEAGRVQIESEVAKGTHVADSATVTVAEAAAIWLEAVARGRDGRDPVESATLRQYRGHVAKHIVPRLGTTRLSRLATPAVHAFRDALLDSGVTRATTKKVLISLGGICGEARARGLLASNPAEGVTIATGGRHKVALDIPSKADVRALLKAAEAQSREGGGGPGARRRGWWLMLRLMAATGLRLSEARGLPWASVDLRGGAIEVAQRADERGKIGACKSASARRRIDIAPDLTAALREWRLASGGAELVFPGAGGRPTSASSLWVGYWKPTCTAAGLVDAEGAPRFGFHALRHFRASVLLESGVDLKEAQREMGHASAQMTLDRYGHLLNDANRERARATKAAEMDAAVFGAAS